MSAAFDGSGYRQRVLAVLRAQAPLRLDDPFLVADLDPEVAHPDGEVEARLARVLAFLQRERGSAKYATLATELIRRRAEWEQPLRDAATRERVRARVLAQRRDGEAERLAKVDGYLATVRERFGGIPASRVDGLRRLAAAAGVSAAEFDARLAHERIIDDGAGSRVAPLPPEVRGQIRDRLDELRALRHGDRTSTASLWGFLGVPPDAPPARIAAAYEAVAAANARRAHDREKTVTADLLAMVRARLLEGDPAAYTAGLLADAADELRPAIEEHVLLDGEVTAVAFEGLMRQALAAGRGLSVVQIRSVILDIARELGAPVSTGATVDFVVCPSCGRPEPAGGARVCRYCDTDLYLGCPSCGRLTEAAAVVCRHCGRSIRQSRDASEALSAIRRALDDGRPAEAAELVTRARPVLTAVGGAALRAGEELAARASAALAAADAGWRALADDRAAGRAEAALEGARWLVAQAADVPGPDGRLAAEVLDELTAAHEMIRRRVDAALALPNPADREAALVAVLASASDNQRALAALAALPLPPPTELVAVPAGARATPGPVGGVVLRWRAVDSAEQVSYRVDRVVAGPPGGAAVRSSLGTTGATELIDAAAPAWTPVYYEVTAVSGTRRSVGARTAPLVVPREVAQPQARQTSAGVRLSWRLDGPPRLVTIERVVEAVDDEAAADGGGSSVTVGSVRHTRVSGYELTDPDVRPGVTYRYRLSVEYVAADGTPARTPGVETMIAVIARPRPVLDLSVGFVAGETVLRWTAQPNAEVAVYATAGVLPDAPGQAAPGPLGMENSEVALPALTGPVRLVGTSRDGRLADPAAAGPVVYTPVTVSGGRGVVGRAVQHVAAGGITDLRAEDRGDELALFFRLAPGLGEARVLWRRDRMPTGPDDQGASAATVTTSALALHGGGWRLAAPRDGWPYYIACYPVFRVGGQARAAAAGAELVARASAQPLPTPAAPPDAPPAELPHQPAEPATGPAYLAPMPPPAPAAAPPSWTGPSPVPAAAQAGARVLAQSQQRPPAAGPPLFPAPPGPPPVAAVPGQQRPAAGGRYGTIPPSAPVT
ncbi:MAG: zinc ribbon domain-containing protein [Frankia sp.]|nr:zinc ribbon domain-containing protein [Frankia sp.]